MPTQAKVDRVAELREKLENCSIVISTGYSGIGVNQMVNLRRRMREGGVEFIVVKNNLLSPGRRRRGRCPSSKTSSPARRPSPLATMTPPLPPRLSTTPPTPMAPWPLQGAVVNRGEAGHVGRRA